MKHKNLYWYYVVLTAAGAFVIGTVFHNIYDWSGGNVILGLFFPINESIWEHLKLIFYPLLILWAVTARRMQMDPEFTWTGRYTACMLSVAVGSAITAAGFYLLYCGFGITAFFVDLTLYALGLFCGQFLATHLTFHTRIPKWIGVICTYSVRICLFLSASSQCSDFHSEYMKKRFLPNLDRNLFL